MLNPLVLFPFKDNDTPLINAVCLSAIKLWNITKVEKPNYALSDSKSQLRTYKSKQPPLTLSRSDYIVNHMLVNTLRN